MGCKSLYGTPELPAFPFITKAGKNKVLRSAQKEQGHRVLREAEWPTREI